MKKILGAGAGQKWTCSATLVPEYPLWKVPEKDNSDTNLILFHHLCNFITYSTINSTLLYSNKVDQLDHAVSKKTRLHAKTIWPKSINQSIKM